MRRARAVDPTDSASIVGKVSRTNPALQDRTANSRNQPVTSSKYGPRLAKEAAEEKKREQQRQQYLKAQKEHWSKVIADLQKEETELCESIRYTREDEVRQFEQLIEDLIIQHEADDKELDKSLEDGCNVARKEIAALVQRRMDLQAEERFDTEQMTHAEEALLLKHLDGDDALKQEKDAKAALVQINLQLKEVKHLAIESKRALDAKQAEEQLKQSDGYGVSEDVARIVSETKKAEEATRQIEYDSRVIEMQRRAKFNSFEELKGTIRVYCRIKGGTVENPARLNCDAEELPASPTSSSATSSSRGSAASIEGESLKITQTKKNATSTGTKDVTKVFKYDRVYGTQTNQSDVFDDVGPLIDSSVDGYKVCIFAYGQTGSGKTFTMEGPAPEGPSKKGGAGAIEQLSESAGVIPRSINKIFQRAHTLAAEGWTYTMRCTFLEIYNDTIRDLLETSDAYHKSFAKGEGTSTRHEIRHQGKTETTVTNVQEKQVNCPADVHKLLHLAVSNRHVAKTLMNDRSSRSHCVFTMKIDGRNDSIGQTSTGTLCLVDLAGSERVNESGAQGQQVREAVAINKSLSALGDCIHAMGSPGAVVSWRANKLTHLLQNYLGGEGAKMLMFVMISNKEEHVRESLNSLDFAEKVNNTHIGNAKKRTGPAH